MLALRHFEGHGRAEEAQVLGITQEAGAKRYFRALKRLKDALTTLLGVGKVSDGVDVIWFPRLRPVRRTRGGVGRAVSAG
jgi:hypothetical protein